MTIEEDYIRNLERENERLRDALETIVMMPPKRFLGWSIPMDKKMKDVADAPDMFYTLKAAQQELSPDSAAGALVSKALKKATTMQVRPVAKLPPWEYLMKCQKPLSKGRFCDRKVGHAGKCHSKTTWKQALGARNPGFCPHKKLEPMKLEREGEI